MTARTTSVRLTEEDQKIVEDLKRHTGVQRTSDLIRFCLRQALHNPEPQHRRPRKAKPL